MKKKVIALIMIIPLIFLITLFSISQVASINANVPVSGIKITTQNDNGFIRLDMANYKSDYYMTARVEPSNAYDQKYAFGVSAVSQDEKLADVQIEQDGQLLVNSDGKAKITATSNDGGFTDSVILSVRSSKVLSVTPTVMRTDTSEPIELTMVETNHYAMTVNGGGYTFGKIIVPTELNDSDVRWSSSNVNVMDINTVTGRANAKISGASTITAVCENGLNGPITVTIDVTVNYLGGEAGLTIDGKENNFLVFAKGTNKIDFLLELETANPRLGISQMLTITTGNTNFVTAQEFKNLDSIGKRFKVTLTLMKGHPAEISFNITAPGQTAHGTLDVSFSEFDFNVYTSYHTSKDQTIYQKNGTSITYVVIGEPSEDGITYDWSLTGDGLEMTVDSTSAIATIKALKMGSYSLTVTALKDGTPVAGKTKTKTITVVRGVYSLEFLDNAKTYGLEDILAIGNKQYVESKDDFNDYHAQLGLNVQYDNGDVSAYTGSNSNSDILFSSSNSSILEPLVTQTDLLRATVKGDGKATMTATWKYAEYFNQKVSSSIVLRCVNKGSMVQNYLQLKKSTEKNYPVVLTSSVMLGWENMTVAELESESKLMDTDYDWTFYRNKDVVAGKQTITPPQIRYVMEFKNDVYGNGYTINANNFTMAQDRTGKPLLFKGPLDFVSSGTAAVKAQDNIVFLVRESDIIIDNVILKGCSDESLSNGENGIDLTKLNYTGTTLEISGSTTLVNSRVNNGRTVIRIFGGETTNGDPIVEDYKDVNLEEERLFAHIESCIISHGREFLVKIGSNRAVRAKDAPDMASFSPTQFRDKNGKYYKVYDNLNAKDEYFYDNYVITDVTLKDSVLATCGLFTIGMETHFSGSMLDGHAYFPDTWVNCASTSFASVLHLEGDIDFYDWKELAHVDSSTLIETTGDASEFLRLDINTMLEKVASYHAEYNDIIARRDDKKYVHGGIALYGGGYNYSCIDMSQMTTEALKNYEVNLSILAEGETDQNSTLYLQGTALPIAAGNQNFAFYMYNNDSITNYEHQQQKLQSNEAYILPVAPVPGD